LLDGAEQIFALLRPLGAAAYFATRYPDRSIALAASVIRDPTSTPERKATAYRVWALALREQGDLDAARAMLWEAYQRASDRDDRARILRDTAYTHGIAGDWYAAERAYRDALALAPDSVITKSRLAFALMEQGSFGEAERIFEELRTADPLWVEPHRGLAQVALRRWDVWKARARYREAILVASSPAERALVDRDIADLYAGLGCMKEARGLYRQAGMIEVCYAGPGADGRCRGIFGEEDRACPLLALAPPPA
jgi:tetratricopeptide (TPR) repeat protein